VNTAAPFTVLNVVLDSGERLPCLVETATWIPVRVATRWAVRYRRYRVQSSTLANNLRVLAHVYRWAREMTAYDLDDHLTGGETLRGREIESLANSLRVRASTPALDTGAFDHQLAVVEDFLKWSLDSENRGGQHALSLEQLTSPDAKFQSGFEHQPIPQSGVRRKGLRKQQCSFRSLPGPNGTTNRLHLCLFQRFDPVWRPSANAK